MIPTHRILLVFTLLAATRLAAQADSAAATCPADTTRAAKVCAAGFDALTILLPVEDALASGGNPVPGTAGAIGRFGHFRLSGRVGFTSVALPSTRYSGATDTVPLDRHLLVPIPRLDLSAGLFSKKLPLGTVAVDLLGSVVVLPTNVSGRYRVDPSARTIGPLALGLGYGFRAALAMGKGKPTVSLSVVKRDLPVLHFGDLAAGDQSSVSSNLSAITVRLFAGGKTKLLYFAAGAGVDLIKGDGTVSWHDQAAGTDSSIAVPLSTMRITVAMNAAIDLGPLTLWGEGGFQIGKTVEVTTKFEGINPNAGRFYGGLGVAIQL